MKTRVKSSEIKSRRIRFAFPDLEMIKLGEIGSGDTKLVLWSTDDGREVIETNGDPVFAGENGFQALRLHYFRGIPSVIEKASAKRAKKATHISHTPGPWQVDCRSAESPCIIRASFYHRLASSNHRLESIAEVFGSSPVRECNARLLALSPELLEALEALVKDVHAISGYWTEGLANSMDFAAQVIAKVKGGAK